MAKKIINVVYQVDDKALLSAKSNIQGIEKETKDSEKEMLKLNKAIKKTGDEGSKSFLNFKNIVGLVSVAAIAGLVRQIGMLGIKQEQLNIAFTTFLGSASKAKILLAELNKFSIITPFTPDQVNNAAKTLLAFGFQAKEIIPTLKILGDVSSGTGKDLSEMAVIFGQIRSTGRLMGQDLLQLINAGFNPLQVISQKTGVSVGKLKADMEKGLITFGMVEQAFKDATSAGGLFFNLMEAQSQTLGGKISTVQGNFEELGKAIFKLSVGPIPEIVEKFNTFLAGIVEFLNAGDVDAIAEIGLKRFRDRLIEIDELVQSSNKKVQEQGREMQNIFAQDLVNAINEVTVELDGLQEQMEKGILTQDEASAQDAVKRAELKGYKGLLEETIGLKHKDVEETKKQVKEDKERSKALAELNKQMGFQTAAQKVTAKEKEGKELDRIEKENNDRSNANADRQRAYEKEKLKQAEEEKWRILEESADRKRRIDQAVTDFAIDSIQQVLYATLLTNEKDFTAQQDKFEEELLLAGDNERAKDQIRLKQEQQENLFRERQRQQEQRNAIKKIGIDTAVNIIRSIVNNGGIPLGLPFGALAAAAGVVQIATVRKLAKGEVMIDGPGTNTSDSIPAMLSRNESIINADASIASPNLLNAINDRKIDDRILTKLVANGGSQVNVFDDSRIIKTLNDNAVDYEKHGYTLMKVQGAKSNFKKIIRSKVQGY